MIEESTIHSHVVNVAQRRVFTGVEDDRTKKLRRKSWQGPAERETELSMNGPHKKVPESQSASSTSKRSQKPSRNNNKPERRQRTDEDVAAVIRDLDQLEVKGECERIAKARGVLLRAALGPGRSKCVTLARDDIIAFLVKRFAYSSPEAGRLLRMNHATVLCSIERSKARAVSEPRG
ncbi:MAG TPA: hypothetical protein VMI75_14255 [Polyangiaceae bacterium]|nr:hypothetical protein [Polyangiaceae bacterium]